MKSIGKLVIKGKALLRPALIVMLHRSSHEADVFRSQPCNLFAGLFHLLECHVQLEVLVDQQLKLLVDLSLVRCRGVVLSWDPDQDFEGQRQQFLVI